MKEKLQVALGSFGAILYYVIMLALILVPVFLLRDFGVSWYFQALIAAALYFIPGIGTIGYPVVYIVAFIAAIRFETPWLSVVYFVCLAVYIVFIIIPGIIRWRSSK